MQPLLNDLLPKCLSNVSMGKRHIEDSPEEYTRKVGLLALNLIKQTYQSLLDTQYQKLDALVGETSCQIRATYVAEHAPKYLATAKRKQLLDTVAEVDRLAKVLLLEKSSKLQGTNVATTIDRWVKKHEVKPVELDCTDRYLILSHLLTTTRGTINSRTTDFDNLNNYLVECEKKLEDIPARHIVFRAKSILSQQSIHYVKTKATALNSHILWILSHGKQVLDVNGQGLQCSPCYYTCKLLIEQVKKLQVPIILLIKHEDEGEVVSTTKLVLSCTEENGLRLITSVEESEGSNPCIVLDGISRQKIPPKQVIENLLGKYDVGKGWGIAKLEELILAAAAIHPQYAGKKKGEGIPLYSEGSKVTSLLEYIRSKITVISHEEISKHLQACDPKTVKEARIECDKNALTVDSYTLLGEVIVSKLKLEAITALAEVRNLGELEDGSPRPNALYALKHLYNLSLEEGLRGAWKGGSEI